MMEFKKREKPGVNMLIPFCGTTNAKRINFYTTPFDWGEITPVDDQPLSIYTWNLLAVVYIKENDRGPYLCQGLLNMYQVGEPYRDDLI